MVISPMQNSPDWKCPHSQEQLGEPEYVPSVLQVMFKELPGLTTAFALHLAEVVTALRPMGVSG